MVLLVSRRVYVVGLLLAMMLTAAAADSDDATVQDIRVTVSGCVVHTSSRLSNQKVQVEVSGKDTILPRLPCQWRQYAFGLTCVAIGVVAAWIHALYVTSHASKQASLDLNTAV
jgi:hypothetical protein